MNPDPSQSPTPAIPPSVPKSATPGGAAPNPPAARPRLVRYWQLAIRLAFVAVILACGFALLDLYRNLFTDAPPPPPRSQPEPTELLPVDTLDLRDTLIDDGVWAVGGSEWAVGISHLSPEEAEARLRSHGEPLGSGLGEVADLERELLKGVKETGTRTPAPGGGHVYRGTLNEVRVRVVTQIVDGRERVRLGQMLWNTAGDEVMTLLEATPSSSGGTRTADPLLPLPPGTALQARRWSGNRVTGELIGPWDDGKPLPAEWEQAGWTRHPLRPGETDNGLEFRRGGTRVQVWRLGIPGGIGSLLLIPAPPRP
jgi:hypothetical protein